jgi:hypothetical protein
MQFELVSDLHIDFDENYTYCMDNLFPTTSILVVAGDTCSKNGSGDTDRYEKFKKEVFGRWEQVIEVPGNHTFYGSDIHDPLFTTYNKTSKSRHTLLNNSCIKVGDTKFICSTLWSKLDPLYTTYIVRNLNDYSYIGGFTPVVNDAMNKVSVEFIEKELSKWEKCVVVTHHIPLVELVHERYRYDTLNSAFANNLRDLVLDYADVLKVWCYGHTHTKTEVEFNEIKYMCNPLGYYYEWSNGREYKPKVIEV